MSSKRSRRKKKHRSNFYNKDYIKNVSKFDIEELKLLNLQEVAVGILLYSDLFFYLNVNQNIQMLLEENNESKEIEVEKIIKSLYSFYNFAIYGLVGMVLLLVIDATRYRNLNIEISEGEIKKELSPELHIAIGGVFQVLCYKYFVISTMEFYKRALFDFYYIYNSNRNLLLNICMYMKIASIIRIGADCFFYESTILSIDIIHRRYEKDKNNGNFENPDSSLLIGAILYLIARSMIAKANIWILNEVYNDTDSDNKELYLIPNKLVVLGNIYGVIGNLYGVYGIFSIYMRDMNQPIIGI